MVVFICLYDTSRLVCGGECSCPHSGRLANPMRECLGFLWRQKSIVFLFYLLDSYVSISGEEGHTETRGKDSERGNMDEFTRCYSGASFKNDNNQVKFF